MFRGCDASGHRSGRPRDGAGHIIVFEGGDGGGERDVAGVGRFVRHVRRHADKVGFGYFAVIR